MTSQIKSQRWPKILLLAAGCLWCLTPPAYGDSWAKVWEENLVLPTYQAAPPDLNPRFYNGRTYQGAKATFYPYPVSDQLTDRRDYQEYQAVHLENPYVKISILPQLGGRIFAAVDKGNNYDFFYRQHVIKPALIGMLGAWISGGVEWNVPHHHRATSFQPVDYTLEANEDGSKTVWVGETELRHRMKWIVGLTLHPDRSYIEMTVKLFNRTPEAQSFLFWINPAVHANTNYQVLFPPSTEWVVQHGKPEFASWPIARQFYGRTDYTRGVDISWWKNHPSPVSFFAWDTEEDFFGGYDHGRQAGVVQISNHHVSPGKKFFEWGNGPEGEMWSRILTETDGPYLELMAGSYSDNQPDYSWCQPGEVKVFKHYWYPIRQLDGLKNANLEAALNLEVSNRVARVAFNTTGAYAKARAVLRAGNTLLVDKSLRISPNDPFIAEAVLPEGVAEEGLEAILLANDQELISYKPIKRTGTPMPTPVKRPAAPKDIKSNEELYLTGLRIEQLYSPAFDPVPYYQEAIRRDPGDYRANTALGILYCKQARFNEAEPLLRTGVSRASENYLRPKDGEAQYYLGVALRAAGKFDGARKAFYRAIWSQAWQPAGYYALAEIASLQAHYAEALSLVQQSLTTGALNTKALELKTSLLRKLDRPKEAMAVTQNILAIDPLNFRALHDQVLILTTSGALEKAQTRLKQLSTGLHGEANAYLELAMDYLNAGFFDEASQVLETYVAQAPDRTRIFPLVYYYLAYCQDAKNRPEKAKEYRLLAAQMPPDYCFPFQQETEGILRDAMEKNPLDARAPYYLGNLLFDNQPLKAIAAWEKAVQLDANFAPAHRNLGLARAQTQKNLPSATDNLEKAVALDPTNARLYYELDVLYEAGGTSLAKRLQNLTRRPEIVAQREDATTRLLALLTADGQCDEALRILRTRHFHNWEGSGELHDFYVNACSQRSRIRQRAQQFEGALKDAEAAFEYPVNQEVGKPRQERRLAQIEYLIGLAQEGLGTKDQAEAAFKKAAQAGENSPSEEQFYKALALQKTGQNDSATKIFEGLVKHGLAELERTTETVDYFAKFGEKRAERLRLAQARYLAGLGYLGQGKTTEANTQFNQALEQDPCLLGALTWKEQAIK
jgi:tetratricopeptide (TPR) repeat protein